MVLSTPGFLGVDVMNHDHDSAQEANHHPLYLQAGVHKGGSNVVSLPHRKMGPSVPSPRFLESSSRRPAASTSIFRRRGALPVFFSFAIPPAFVFAAVRDPPRHPAAKSQAEIQTLLIG